MALRFKQLPTLVRKDSLGPGYLSLLANNLKYVRSAAFKEHLSTGEHNTMEVARRIVQMASGGTTHTPSSSDISSSSRPATGSYTINLAANRFTTNIWPQINIKGDDVVSVPHVAGYEVVDATQIKVYLKKLTGSLGSGNTWAAVNSTFDLALHSEPIVESSYPAAGQVAKLKGDFLTDASTDWNAHVIADGNARAQLLGAHQTTGVHLVQEVASTAGNFSFDGADYDLVDNSGASLSFNHVSTGILEVTYTAVANPSMCFVSPDYNRLAGSGSPGDTYIIHAYRSATTKTIFYIYQYDSGSNSWSRADTDFFFAFHFA